MRLSFFLFVFCFVGFPRGVWFTCFFLAISVFFGGLLRVCDDLSKGLQGGLRSFIGCYFIFPMFFSLLGFHGFHSFFRVFFSRFCLGLDFV